MTQAPLRPTPRARTIPIASTPSTARRGSSRRVRQWWLPALPRFIGTTACSPGFAWVTGTTRGPPRRRRLVLTEPSTLGRTLKKRAKDVLAYFDGHGTSNGRDRGDPWALEHLRGSDSPTTSPAHCSSPAGPDPQFTVDGEGQEMLNRGRSAVRRQQTWAISGRSMGWSSVTAPRRRTLPGVDQGQSYDGTQPAPRGLTRALRGLSVQASSRGSPDDAMFCRFQVGETHTDAARAEPVRRQGPGRDPSPESLHRLPGVRAASTRSGTGGVRGQSRRSHGQPLRVRCQTPAPSLPLARSAADPRTVDGGQIYTVSSPVGWTPTG